MLPTLSVQQPRLPPDDAGGARVPLAGLAVGVHEGTRPLSAGPHNSAVLMMRWC